MQLLKFIVVGAIVGVGIDYITKKGSDGRSILDDITDKAPDWFGEAKKFAVETISNTSKSARDKF